MPGAEAFVDAHMPDDSARAFSTVESQRRLLERDCSHVCLFPMRRPGGGIDGAVAIELECEAAIGQQFVLSGAESELQTIVDVAAPFLLSLPLEGVELGGDPLLPVVGASMAPLIRTLRVFARQRETVLLGGPTGVGKSRLARWCHAQSPRRDKPFVVVDLQTMPEDSQLGELFGWKRGAFTSAVKDNPGLVARAEGGTLFLDEIDKLSMRAQAGLLALLEERSYAPLGDSARSRSADVRFLVGSNVDLLAAVREGRFREDLYYRVHVLPLRVPALRERVDEIPAWATYMLERRDLEHGGERRTVLAADACSTLQGLPWPGNLRQLDNVVRRAASHALVDQGERASKLVVRKRHVEAALSVERADDHGALPRALQLAARAFLDALERRDHRERPWDHEGAGELFRGFVVLEAYLRSGDPAQVFRMLGRESLVRHRNHLKALRRELSRVTALYAELDHKPRPEHADALSRASG